MKPQNFEEKVVWYSLIGTYGFYFLGAQFILTPAIAWLLTLYLAKKIWNQKQDCSIEEKVLIPSTVWVWVISMLVMEIVLLIAHINFDLGVTKMITSSINWARNWPLLALFPFIGLLNIRPQLVYRAVCIICLQSLIFIPICYLASTLQIPNLLYTSPLRFIGGNGIELYNVVLYELDENFQPRLSLFAPWAPALGLVANIYFFLACQESDKKWRLIGRIGSIAMIVVSVSRLAILCLAAVTLLTWVLLNFTQPIVQITAAVVSFFAGILAPLLISFLETFREHFSKVRSSSSRVRGILNRMALNRWWNEAPLWGHGIIEPRGPKITAFMPIGTHHTWFSLLFEKGLVGVLALAVPLLWSFIHLLNNAHKSMTAKVGLNVLLVLFFFTFGEKIEGLAYLYWPGLIVMGIAFKREVQAPISLKMYTETSI